MLLTVIHIKLSQNYGTEEQSEEYGATPTEHTLCYIYVVRVWERNHIYDRRKHHTH